MIQSSEVQATITQSRIPRMHLVLAFAAFILIGANDGAFGVLIPSIRAFYHIDAATLAWLFLVFVLGYLTVSFNNGLLTAKLGQRHFLLLAVGIFMTAAGLVSLGLPFVYYICTAFLLGSGMGMLDAGLNTYVASLPQSAASLNYLHAFYGMGALLGPLVASTWLAWQLSWRVTYATWFGVALVLLVGLWLAFKPGVQPVKQSADGKEEHMLLKTLRLRGVWLGALFLFTYVGVEVSLGSWGYSFLTIARQDPVLFSAWVVSGYWCGLTLGRLILANFATRLGVRRLITLSLGGVVLGLLLTWFLPGTWGAALGFGLTGFCLGPLFPTTIALMPQIVPAHLLPSAIGFLASLGSGGAALFPALAGNLVQHLGFWTLLPFALGLTLLMFCVWTLLQTVRASDS